MLAELTIRNFATIDRLHVYWQRGLNVMTGETGAGKSIILDAVGALLGDRLGADVVRGGADRALVEGVFLVDQSPDAELQALLHEYGLEPEDGALIVSRDIAAAGGRGTARVNGRSVPLAVLQELGERLVDIHGQSQHMALLRTREQLDFVDRFAGVLTERARVASLVRELRSTRETLQRLIAEEREALRQQEMLRHELNEIDRAELVEDEEERLQAERLRLEHVERLRHAATAAYEALSGVQEDVGERPGAIERLGEAGAACRDGARFDQALASEADALESASALAEESARTLRDYLDGLETDPAALERVTERVFVIGDLKRKYGETVSDVLVYAADARRRLLDLDQRSERRDALAGREGSLLKELSAAAAELSGARQAAAEQLAVAVERELADLRLSGTRFCVAVVQSDAADGVPFGERTVAFDQTGIDRVEFLLAANPGEEPRPLARVASGGELARIALALKTTLSRAETRPTLIFDEIDMGVGGRTAPVVGEKLWRVAANGGHQVLCVTHMAQVAAYADHHIVVSKSAADARAETHVVVLEPAGREAELAAMLAGSVTDAALASARELLENAAAIKTASTARPATARVSRAPRSGAR